MSQEKSRFVSWVRGMGERIAMLLIFAGVIAGVLAYAQICESLYGPTMQTAASIGDRAELRRQMGHGVFVDARDEQGETALMAASRAGNLATVEYLLECGADVNLPHRWGSALMLAAYGGHCDVVKALVARGADIHARDMMGRDALCEAVASEDSGTVRALLDAGADPKEAALRDNPLSLAVGERTVELLRMLLDYGADVNLCDADGWTPLMSAADQNAVECAKILIAAGARVDCVDRAGRTASDIARQRGAREVARILASRRKV